MNNRTHDPRASRPAWRRNTLALAVSLTLATAAMAQSTSGSIYGVVPPGTVVTVTGTNGITRTVTAGSDGRYNVANLPGGDYKVEAKGVGTRDATVTIGGGVETSFAINSLETVTVTGTRTASIDMTQTDTRTVFTADILSKIAVGQSLNQVALLAPGVINSNSYNNPSSVSNNNNPLGRAGSANIGSFGGSAASENAFYINGFPVTNPLTNMGATTLPFSSIGQVQVLTGGYGAEYGRSTGGVMNIVTKRGTNEWKGGLYTFYSPAVLRSTPKDLYYPNTGFWNATTHYPTATAIQLTDGTLYQSRSQNTLDSVVYGAYVGGPIIKDRLFIFANAEQTRNQVDQVRAIRTTSTTTPSTAGQAWGENTNTYPRATIKVDWNITDNHLLELTAVQDNAKEKYAYYGYSYATGTHDNVKYSGDHVLSDKSRLYVAQYTGNITDKLSVKLMAGQQKVDHVPDPLPGYDATKNFVNISGSAVPPAYAGLSNPQPYGTVTDPGKDKTQGYRADVNYILGSHELRLGVDRFKADSYIFSKNSGPGAVGWIYNKLTNANESIDGGHGIGSPASAGGFGAGGYYVDQNFAYSGGAVSTLQQAYYIEDRWNITKTFLLSLGFRSDNFTNYNGDKKAYVEQKNNKAPRVGFSWDVNGDAKLKVFGNAGRYFLALPNNVAIRGANATLNSDKYYTYDSIGADGVPVGLHQIAPAAGSTGLCPAGTPGAGTTSTNLECGDAPDPSTVAITNLKPHFQDEFILGMEQVLNKQWSWGAKVTYRDLKSAIDDTCPGECRIFNPGEAATFKIPNGDGTYTYTSYTKEELGFPKLKRKYVALDLFGEYQTARAYGKIEYTLSHNFGNAEGQLNSSLDTGTGGQADVSVTSDWDLPEIMEGANGPLPNNRTHQIKMFGSYKVTDEWRIGGSTIIQSGRPRNCSSYYPYAKAGLYNSPIYYHYCGVAGNNPPAGVTGTGAVIPASPDYTFSPRGSKGTTPWTKTFNVSVSFTPAQIKGLTLVADVLNVFNAQTATTYYEASSSSRTAVNARYGQTLYYTDPRSIRLTGKYDF